MGSIGFVEVPVTDINRAVKFYGTIFDKDLTVNDDGTRKFAVIGDGQDGVGMSLTQTANFEPSSNGPLIYLGFEESIEDTLKRVEDAGGKTVIAKTSMGDFGFFATFHDTEGNTFGIFANP